MDAIRPASMPAGKTAPKLRRPTRAGLALLILSVLLPGVLFGIAASQGYGEAHRQALGHVARTAQILEEHAQKVFETHRLVIDQINTRLRFLDWQSEADRDDLHQLLRRMQDDLEQVATISIADAQGYLQASSRRHPVDRTISFADRDWFQGVKTIGSEALYVSQSYPGRQSGQPVFNVAQRAYAPKGNEAFTGAIAVSVDRSYFETFYKGVETTFEHNVALIRVDGEFLARYPAAGVKALDPNSEFLRLIRAADSGVSETRSRVDGKERIFAYRKVAGYPVFVGFGLERSSAFAPWRENLVAYGLVALLASMALLAMSALALRQTWRWQATADALVAEAASRGRAEEQLRQSQKMEAVGRLTGGVAHDFNNLLTVVTGNLDLALRRIPDGDGRLQKLVSNALEGAGRAAALTHRLLAFSRQQPLEPVALDVNRLVAGMSDLLLRTLGEDVMIETVLAGGLWRTLADPNQLEGAILNLAVNARDAMPGGGKLTIETANAHLDEAYAAVRPEVTAGQYVMIAVCDTGTGMAPETVANAFEPFFTTKPIGKGTGLGLSQVYGFAKQSGGHAAIYSELGHGTTIKLYLPRVRDGSAPSREERPALQAEAGARERETVLVVEDETMVREFTGECLREAGYRVVEASDGPSALAILREDPSVTLVFTDVVLAGPMNGRHVAEEAARLRPGLPVLFTTGYTRNAIVHHGRLDEGVDLIGKPFTAATLRAKVREILDRPQPV